MKVVIQCAARKQTHAGSMRTDDGRPVYFVARPSEMDPEPGVVYAHPDDRTPAGSTWRQRLVSYNRNPGENPLRLLPAYRLYRNVTYEALVEDLGASNVFILSAGWGLLGADFLTPAYDITFSGSAPSAKRRRRNDSFADLRLLEAGPEEPVVFFGGKDYQRLFQTLTSHCQGPRLVLFNSDVRPTERGLRYVRYDTPARTNWHYLAVKDVLGGGFDPLAAL